MNIHSDSSYMSINVRIIQKKLMKNDCWSDWSISWKFRITTIYSFPVIYHENVLSISLLVTVFTVLFTFNFVKKRSSLGFAVTHDQSLQIINFSKLLSQQIQTLPKKSSLKFLVFGFCLVSKCTYFAENLLVAVSNTPTNFTSWYLTVLTKKKPKIFGYYLHIIQNHKEKLWNLSHWTFKENPSF